MDAQEVKYKLQVARALLGTGIVQPERVDKAVRAVAALRRWGPSSSAAYIGGAIRFPDRPAIVDDRGAVTFREVNVRTNALANALRDAAAIRLTSLPLTPEKVVEALAAKKGGKS
ncbi:MAG TPA: hypothetical protein VF706_01255 [Solirubrobacteraceae bacterium]